MTDFGHIFATDFGNFDRNRSKIYIAILLFNDLILNDQIRSNGVRSSDLIVCTNLTSCPVQSEVRKPIATYPDRRTSEASPPASDRKAFTNRTALVVQYAFDPATTSDVVHGSEVLKLDCECM